MNILYLNIQSIRNKIEDLTTYIQLSPTKFHVIVLSETHLKQNELQFFNIPDYEAEHCVRKSERFGGVSIFVRKDFSSFNLIHKLDIDNNNSLLINLDKFDIKIAAFYRQRTSNFNSFLNRLDHILENQNNCFVIGDFNLDLFKKTTDPNIQKYHDLVSSNGFVFLNNLSMPTRVDKNRNTATCIDHIITDSIFHTRNISFILSLDDLFGDHKALLLNVTNPKINPTANRKVFKVERINHEKIIAQNLLANVSSSCFDEFQNDLKSIISSNTISYEKREKFRKSFMTKEVLNFIEIKQNYYRLTKKYPQNLIVKERFSYYRNLCRKKTRALRKKHNEKVFARSMNDPSTTWKNINNLLRNTDSQPIKSINAVSVNNCKITNPSEIAKAFNSFFVTVAEKIHSSITIDRNVFDTLHEFERYTITVPFECPDTSPEEVRSIITALSNSGAKDLNGFSNKLFKKYRMSLCEPLSIMINNSLRNGDFPFKLKIAKVKPLFKSGDKLDMNNYRPVALSSIDGKCLESIMLDRIETHLKNNEILCKYQFGYTKQSNCETAALHILNQIYQNLDKKLFTACMFIDLTKAFDCIDHNLLEKKFQKLGFTTNFMNLLKSYLTDRFQCVEVGESQSPLLRIKNGVFQGSKLAAISFILYINSIFSLPTFGKLFLYADDIAIVYGATSPQELKRQIEYDLKILKIFFDNHFLKMNNAKTKYIVFNGKNLIGPCSFSNFSVKSDDSIIERVESFSYLGLIIDEELKFKQHIEFVKSKILPMTFAIRRIRPYINQKTANQIYFAHINSHLLYMNPFWNVASNNLIETLAVAQRKALRFILNKYSYCPNRELYSQKFLPLTLMNQYNLILLAFKIKHNMIRNNVDLKQVSDIHHYATRQREHFYVQNYETNYGLSDFFTRGLLAYNNLDPYLKSIHSIGMFKRELKNDLLDNYLSLEN